MKKTFLLTLVLMLAAGLVFASGEANFGNKAETYQPIGTTAADAKAPVKKVVVAQADAPILKSVPGEATMLAQPVDKTDIEAYKAHLAKNAREGNQSLLLYTDISEIEPNNDCLTEATPMACDDRVVCAHIDAAGDNADYFVFTLDDTYDTWEITLETHDAGDCGSGPDGADTQMELFEADCATSIDWDDDGGSGLYSYIQAVVDPTGPTNYYVKINHYGTSFAGYYNLTLDCVDPTAGCPEDSITLAFTTDDYGYETSWEVVEQVSGTPIASGSGYSSNTYYEEVVCVAADGCYDVYMYDSYGDGGPTYDIYFNTTLECSGVVTAYGGLVCPNLGGGCSTPTGRCCDYTDPEAIVCTDGVEEANCQGANEIWTYGLNCTDDPCPPLPPANDDCVDAELITGPYPATGTGTTISATGDCYFGGIYDPIVWYEIDLPYAYNDIWIQVCPTEVDMTNAGLNLVTDCDCGGMITANGWNWPDTGCVDFQGFEEWFTSVPNTRGTILWPAYLATGAGYNDGLNYNWTVIVTEGEGPPLNDDCANAEAIGDVTDLPFNTTLATFDGIGECMTSPNIWYSYTATCTGQLSIDLCGSSFDTKLGLYEGPDCPPEPDPPPTPVYLQAGDTFGSAVDIGTTLPGAWTGTTSGYTDDYNEFGIFTCPYTSSGLDVVYSFSPDVDGTYYMGLCNTVWDTKMYIYESTNTAPGAAIQCNDDGCGLRSQFEVDLVSTSTYYIVIDAYNTGQGEYQLDVELVGASTSTMIICDDDGCGYPTSALTLPVTSGEEFIIEVGGWSSYSGPGDITIRCDPPPPNDECADAIPVDCGTTTYGTTYGATVDCPEVLNWEAVWYSIELTYGANEVVIDYCPTGDDGITEMANTGLILYTACPSDSAECEDLYVAATSFVEVACDNGTDSYELTWLNLPAGTYYLPVYTGAPVDFAFDLTCAEFVPCVLECPPGSYMEPETCGDDTNGGCGGDPPTLQFDDILPPITICGTSWAEGNVRDTDWYRYTATEAGYLEWSVTAEFPVAAFIIPVVDPSVDPCVYGGIISDGADMCETATVGAALEPGTYYLWVGAGEPSVPLGENLPCDGSGIWTNDYVATFTWVGGTPELSVDPTSVTGSAPVGGNTTESLLVGNIGGGALTFVATAECDPYTLSNRSDRQPRTSADGVPAVFDFGNASGPGISIDTDGSYVPGTTTDILDCGEVADVLYGQASDTPADDWSIAVSEVSEGLLVVDNFGALGGDINGIHIWGLDAVYSGGWSDCSEDPTDLIITFYEDDGLGAPGTEVSNDTVTVSPLGTGEFFSIFELSTWTVTLPAPVSLPDGGWVGVQGYGDAGCWFLWASSHDPNGDGHSYQYGADPEDSPFDRGFCLLGSVNPCFIDFEANTGMVIAGDPPLDLGVIMDALADELPLGTYTGTITLSSNALNPEVLVPVTFNVVEPITGYPYLIGDANMYNGVWPPATINSDVTFIVGYLRQAPTSQPCLFTNPGFPDDENGELWASADANGSCSVTNGDVTKLVNVFRGNTTTDWCGYNKPDPENYFIPLWLVPGDIPPTPPAGWTGPGYGGGPNQICDNVPVPMGLKVLPSGSIR